MPQAKINGISINYAVSGADTAPPVLLHHPLATNLSVWDDLTAALEPKYRVIRFDARGHGKSEAPAGAYDFKTLAADTIGVLDHLGIPKARYLGLSMGGFVGQILGFTHPQRFHCLVLCSTSSDMTGARDIWEQRISTVANAGITPAIVDGGIARWLAPDTIKSKPDVVSRLRDMIETTPANGYVGWCHAIRDFNVTATLKAIKVPTKVIVGALDPATPPAAARVIHREIAGSEFAEVPRTSHMLQVEEPATFAAEVLPFLAEHGG